MAVVWARFLRIIRRLERWSLGLSGLPYWRVLPSCCVRQGILLEGINHGVEVGGIDVVVDVAVSVRDAWVFGTEAPLSVDNELILMQPSG